MANCVVQNMTVSEVRDAIRGKQMPFAPEDIKTPEDLDAIFKKTRQVIKTAEVQYGDLKETVRRKLYLEEGDTIERYVDSTTGEVLLDFRITDRVGEKFLKLKGKDKAKKISDLADNILKADSGTKVHAAADYIKHYLISQDTSGLIKSGNASRPLNSQELAKVREELGVTPTEFNNLIAGIKENLEEIKKKQRIKDSTGQATIYTEQLIIDMHPDKGRTSEGGTIDALVVFSDMTAGVLDYKSMVPRYDTTDQNARGRREITNSEWIPSYKYEDFNIQISRIADILKTRYGIKGIEFARVVPIHIELARKEGKNLKEGEKLTDKITQISIGEKQNKNLTHIPVLMESTGVKSLDDAVERLSKILHNLRYDNEQKHTSAREEEIARKSMVLSKLILKQDLHYMFEDFTKLVERFSKVNGTLVNISDETINGKVNGNYIPLDKLDEFIRDLEVYKAMLDGSAVYLQQSNILDAKIIGDYMRRVKDLTFNVTTMIHQSKQIRLDAALTKEKQEAIKDSTELSWWERWARSLGEQAGMVFREFRSLLDKAMNSKRLEEQKLEKDVKDQILAVETWGKDNGYKGFDVYKLLLDSNNMLHKEYNKQYSEDWAAAIENKDLDWLNKHFSLKANAKEIYDTNFKTFLSIRGINPKKLTSQDRQDIDTWKKKHDISTALINKNVWYYYYEKVENIEEKYYSDGFKFLKQRGNEPLLNFWKFYTSKMAEFRRMLELTNNYDKLPNNFVPWIRADLVNKLMQGTLDWSSTKDLVQSLGMLKEDDTTWGENITGKIDPNTGAPLREVPRFFLNPLKDASGKINHNIKSIDLGRSLYVFGSMAINYHFMNEIVEPKVEALKDVITSIGIKDTNQEGNQKKLPFSGILARFTGKNIEPATLFNVMVDYHLYGVKIQDKNKKLAKILLNAKSYQQLKELALAPLTWAGNFIQIKGNAYFEGIKGYYYTTKHLNKAHAMMSGVNKNDLELYRSIIYFIEPSPGRQFVKAKELSINAITKNATTDALFWGFRVAEEQVNDNTLISIMQNYGYDSQGNIKRLATLPEGTSSLLDKSSVVDGRLVIEGIVDKDGNVNMDNYTILRNIAVGVAKQIKGQINSEDMNGINMTLMGNLFMGFKNWMPGMIDERAGKLRYNSTTNAITEGKYRALITDMSRDEKGFWEWIGNDVMPSMGSFLFDIATFGSMFGLGHKYKVNEVRARRLFDNYKKQNIHDFAVQNMSFEDYLQYKQGAIRSLAAELTIILSFIAILMYLRGEGDDGEPRWKENMTTRTLFRIVNRGKRELAFFISPGDWTIFFRAPLPITSLITDFTKLMGNTLDEIGDVVWGEDVKREGIPGTIFGRNVGKDKKGVGYETARWFPTHKTWRTLEIFKEHEEMEY
jgi:hypothetical protein